MSGSFFRLLSIFNAQFAHVIPDMGRVTLISDIDFNFIAHPNSGDVVRLFDDASVKAAAKHLVLTHFYSRPFHPEYGSHVAGLLFENDGPLTRFAIEHSIKQVLESHEPRVTVESVEAQFRDNENSYNIEITLSVKGLLESVNFELQYEIIGVVR